MKRFLTLVLIFIIPVLVAAVGYEILLRKIPNDYRYKKHYLDQHANSVNILLMGSSHTYYGINPEHLSLKAFNGSYVFQSLDLDLAILKKYEQHWDSLRYIVLPVDYFSLYSRLGTGDEAWRVKNYNLYWDLGISRNIVENSEVLTNPINTNSKRVSEYYLHKISFITSSPLGWGVGYDSTRELDISGRSAAARHLAKDDRYFAENLSYLVSIIEFAAKKNVKVVLITSPAWKAYTDNLDPVQMGRTTRTADSLAQRYDNTVYFNLLTDSAFTAADYYDGDHLNDKGAKKFTLKLDSLIQAAERKEGITF
jgi:hypothetical protein